MMKMPSVENVVAGNELTVDGTRTQPLTTLGVSVFCTVDSMETAVIDGQFAK